MADPSLHEPATLIARRDDMPCDTEECIPNRRSSSSSTAYPFISAGASPLAPSPSEMGRPTNALPPTQTGPAAETEEAAEGSGSSAASLLASLQLQCMIRSDKAAAVALWPISAQAAGDAGDSRQLLQQGQRVFTLPGDRAHMLLQQPRLVALQHSWGPAASGPGLVHGQAAREAVHPRPAFPPQRVHSGKRKLPLELAGAALATTRVQHPAHLLRLPAGPAAEGKEDAGGPVRKPGSNRIVPVKGGTFGSAVRLPAQPKPAAMADSGPVAPAPSAIGPGAAANVSGAMAGVPGAAPGMPSSPRQSLLQMLTPRSAARK